MLMQLGYAGGEQKQQEMRRREQAQLEMRRSVLTQTEICAAAIVQMVGADADGNLRRCNYAAGECRIS